MASDDTERFRERYAISGAAAMLAAEVDALGTDYQANGYTTMAQADDVGTELALRRRRTLLDVGAGCGWPGLHLAKTLGCSVVSLDSVLDGVRVARRRAASDGIAERSWQLCASADALPLRPQSVDAIVHADVLC